MKKPVIFGTLALVVLFCAFGVWFWSLGAVSPEAMPPIRIEGVTGSVEIKKAGTDTYQALSTSQQVAPGDSIRSGEESRAEIHWGDRGITRIEPKTEIVVEAMPEQDAVTKSSIKLHLLSGKIWSRVVKLLDVQSSVQVRTDTVVATVRGTAFGVAEASGGLESAVTESVVQIEGETGKNATLVREGRWGRFAADGAPEIVRDLTNQDEWPKANAEKDRQFDDAQRQASLQRLRRLAGSHFLPLQNLSEELHLAMQQGDAKSDLANAYALRRIARSAVDSTIPLDQDRLSTFIDNGLRGHAPSHALLLEGLRDALRVVDTSTEQGKGIRLSLWHLREIALGDTPVGKRYALALNIDDKIDDLFARGQQPSLPAEAAELRLEIDQWQQGSRDGLSPEESSALAAKADALRERLRNVGEAEPGTGSDIMSPLVPPVPPTGMVSGTTSTTDRPGSVKPGMVTTTRPLPGQPVPPPASSACASPRVSLFIKPTAISLSETARVVLIKACADGQTEDVTERSVFNAADLSLADVRGSTVYPKKNGRVNLTGSYVLDGRMLMDTQTLTIADETNGKKLTAVRVMTNGPTSLTTGQRAVLDANAVYSDGSSNPVAYQCVWSVSDPKMALISGNTFQHLQGTGTVDAICGYTENGVTVRGSLEFTISLDPSLQPTRTNPNPSYPYYYVN